MSTTPMHATYSCPRCAARGRKVAAVTVEAIVADGVERAGVARVCETRDCAVLYYGDDWCVDVSAATVRPGFKVGPAPHLVCYCFGHAYENIAAEIDTSGTSSVVERIERAIADGGCWCKTRNPTGRCCLGEIRRFLRERARCDDKPRGGAHACCGVTTPDSTGPKQRRST